MAQEYKINVGEEVVFVDKVLDITDELIGFIKGGEQEFENITEYVFNEIQKFLIKIAGDPLYLA